jgi:anti-repressor protein
MKNLVTIQGVRGYLDDQGNAMLNLEDTARGLGFAQTQTKRGKEYTSIRWVTIAQYLDSFGFPQRAGEELRDSYVPENIFYRLAMKANNATAESFQAKVCDEILPTIRKTGSYNANPMNLPTTYPEAMRLLADTYEAKDALEAKVIAMEPKARAFDVFIDAKGYYTVGTAAKMLNTGRNRLFAFMAIHKIIMDNNVPYQRYVDSGYFAVKGHNGITYVSPKGLQWLSEKIA